MLGDIPRKRDLAGRAKFSDDREAQEEGNLQLQKKECAPKNVRYAASVHLTLCRTNPEARIPLAERASEGSPQSAEPGLDAGCCATGD